VSQNPHLKHGQKVIQFAIYVAQLVINYFQPGLQITWASFKGSATSTLTITT
jgi:hypothetical protein